MRLAKHALASRGCCRGKEGQPRYRLRAACCIGELTFDSPGRNRIMRKASGLALSVLVLVGWLLAPSQVWAGPTPHGTIRISNQNAGTGSVTCSGAYTVDTGWSVTGITLIAYPQAGGPQSSQQASYGSGNWGPTTISGLTGGIPYTVYATMTIMMGTTTQTINSSTTTLTPK